MELRIYPGMLGSFPYTIHVVGEENVILYFNGVKAARFSSALYEKLVEEISILEKDISKGKYLYDEGRTRMKLESILSKLTEPAIIKSTDSKKQDKEFILRTA
ncbi:MAG: hypothetical protein QW331_03710 [Candidatus Woesearchaeota archaeon]